MSEFRPYDYQQVAKDWILDHPACGLFLEMGLGKTVITLTAVKELMWERYEVARVLVIAPLRVAATVWSQEAQKWDHLRDLRVARVLGSQSQRIAALHERADIYVINRENVEWLVNYFQQRKEKWPFDMVVIDELSSFKSASSQRFKALRRVRPAVKRIVGLTGTPAPNGLLDLWPQVYLLDGGERLGKTLTGYRTRYFNEGRRNAQIVYDWKPKPGAPEKVYELLSDICVSMRSSDYLSLPERMDQYVDIVLPDQARKAYERLERDLVLPLKDEVVTAANAAVVTGKLLQLSGGAVYGETGEGVVIHQAKLDALTDLLEASCGHPVLCYYGYRHEAERIKAAFPQARLLKTEQDVADWNDGKVQLLLAHPASAGHGLNLQKGGHIMVWYTLTWSLELYQQANARLHRNGQNQPVMIYHLITRDSIDEEVLQVLMGKCTKQDALIDAVKARIDRIVG